MLLPYLTGVMSCLILSIYPSSISRPIPGDLVKMLTLESEEGFPYLQTLPFFT